MHGHIEVREPEIENNRINVNTGCGNSGFLCAVVLPEMTYLSSSTSPGHEMDWDTIRQRLGKELKALAELFNSEEIEELEIVE